MVILFIFSAYAGISTPVMDVRVDRASEQSKLVDNLLYCASSDNPYRDESIIRDTYLRYIDYFKNNTISEYSVNMQRISSAGSREDQQQTSKTLNSNLMDSSWPMYCHDMKHTSRSPYFTSNNLGTVKWTYQTNGWIEDTPVIGSDGSIYFGGNYGGLPWYLISLNSNGTFKWRFKTGGSILGSTPIIAEDGAIYVGSWDDRLYAINPNGTLKWRFLAYDTIATSPAIAEDGTIYFGTMGTGHKIYAVNPDGTEKWQYPTDDKITSSPAIGDDGTIFIGSMDNNLYALYPNGTLRWKFSTGDVIKGSPSIAEDGTIYIGSHDGYLYAIYPNNGIMKWRCSIGWGSEVNPSIGIDGTIYIGGEKLYAVYPNGTRKWAFDLGLDRWIGHSSAAISAEGTIYIGTVVGDGKGGEIIAINSNGTEKWRKWLANTAVNSAPSIGQDGTIYIGTSSGNSLLYAFGFKELKCDADGPYEGLIDAPVQLTGSAAGGYTPYTWQWNFGDSNTSTEQNPTHTYTQPGNYTVTLTVTDNEGNTSSDTTWANIRESNNPPTPPIITGETQGKAGTSYEYTFQSTDPDDDEVSYRIDWDDDTEITIGPFASGEEASASHTWQEKDTYIIRAKAIDSFDAESDWATLEVTMPRNKPISNVFETHNRLLFRLITQLLERNVCKR